MNLSQSIRWSISAVLVVVTSGLSPHPLSAESWSDSTGKFQIEADYVRVSGKSVVLRRADGTTLSVPIARLSDQSRNQAKKLFEQAKQNPQNSGAGNPTAKEGSDSRTSGYQPASRFPNLIAPTRPTVAPLKPFPNSPTLQTQRDYLVEQVLAGHPEAIWYTLPQDFRDKVDSQAFRDALRPAMEQYSEQNKSIEKTMEKAVEVLTTKKDFVLGSPMLSAKPEALTLLKQAYDPLVGVIYELVLFSANSDSAADTPMSEILDYHLAGIGAHAQALLPIAPAGMVDTFTSQITVSQTDDTHGTLTIPGQGGENQVIEMVLYQERWLPNEFVEMWSANQDNFIEFVENAVSEQAAANQNPQMIAMTGLITQQVDGLLDQLLAAKTQTEFDQTINQAILPLMMLGGGLGPGGPGLAPGGPGGFEVDGF